MADLLEKAAAGRSLEISVSALPAPRSSMIRLRINSAESELTINSQAPSGPIMVSDVASGTAWAMTCPVPGAEPRVLHLTPSEVVENILQALSDSTRKSRTHTGQRT